MEYDRLPIDRERGTSVDLGIVGDAGNAGAVRVHHIDLRVSVSLRDKRDARAVRGERRIVCGSGVGWRRELRELRQIRPFR